MLYSPSNPANIINLATDLDLVGKRQRNSLNFFTRMKEEFSSYFTTTARAFPQALPSFFFLSDAVLCPRDVVVTVVRAIDPVDWLGWKYSCHIDLLV